MRRVEEASTYYGASELRISFDKILAEALTRRVIIEKRHKPVAVLLSIEEFKEYEEAMEALEDEYFSEIVKERMKKPVKYLTHEEAKKKLGIE
jgi:prevent-host-death family protein